MPLTLYDTPNGISLRLLTTDDTQAYLDLIQVTRFPHQAVEPLRDDEFYTLDAQTRRIQDRLKAAEEGAGYQFGIYTIKDDLLIGQISLNNVTYGVANYADMGYFIHPDYQGGGRMTAAVKLAVAYAFRALKLNRVQAAILPTNAGSQRVLEKNGFQAEGIARKYLKINGSYQDHRIYAVLAEDLSESLQQQI
ncbi:GNAT family N-acetyltransferase [Paenibacillus illinoisensis]|uniref:Ribosomal-protein-alanine N-acetyltransferase n=1 Tax=Paenibacillus illinoisensis TaxID=59845 RepID=A0A2W0CC16_9BACL|nr:GNAT family protein [Paenibacillus illinoisensis]PYY30206.1 Ribosomal-protein-alanine N-acetyltransferase [Paenibacillus illinoisensis]